MGDIDDDGVLIRTDAPVHLAVLDNFQLDRNADGGDRMTVGGGFRQRLAHYGQGRHPDFLGVVLDPAVFRKMLGKFTLRGERGAPVVVEQHGA